jgi:hypothetical protein
LYFTKAKSNGDVKAEDGEDLEKKLQARGKKKKPELTFYDRSVWMYN